MTTNRPEQEDDLDRRSFELSDEEFDALRALVEEPFWVSSDVMARMKRKPRGPNDLVSSDEP